jgi:osmotically-inducible protein OsmY
MMARARRPSKSPRENESSKPENAPEALRRVEAQLRSSPFLPLRTIRCEYYEGRLVLQGSVPTYYCKQMAQAVAQATPGVDRLENRIEVSETHRPAH